MKDIFGTIAALLFWTLALSASPFIFIYSLIEDYFQKNKYKKLLIQLNGSNFFYPSLTMSEKNKGVLKRETYELVLDTLRKKKTSFIFSRPKQPRGWNGERIYSCAGLSEVEMRLFYIGLKKVIGRNSPYLIKVVNGEIIVLSIEKDLINLMKQKGNLEKLLTKIEKFYSTF